DDHVAAVRPAVADRLVDRLEGVPLGTLAAGIGAVDEEVLAGRERHAGGPAARNDRDAKGRDPVGKVGETHGPISFALGALAWPFAKTPPGLRRALPEVRGGAEAPPR